MSFDRPGLGQSPDVEGPRTPTAIAREIKELLSALGVSGPNLLVGHSMGGIHVLRYADLHPESVAGVVLLDTPPPDFGRERDGLLWLHLSSCSELVVAAGSGHMIHHDNPRLVVDLVHRLADVS